MFCEGKANYVVEVTRNSRQKKLRSSFEDMERGLGRGVEVEIDRNKRNTVGQKFYMAHILDHELYCHHDGLTQRPRLDLVA